MQWGKWILAYLFYCVHRHTSWPHRDSAGLDYICCLDCGRELPYSTRRMSIVSKEERLEERNADGRKGFESVGCNVIAGFDREVHQAS
jgi:hypothetical protein